jgi:hypothetical protein
MNFGEALQLLKDGSFLQRKGWNGKGMFIYLVSGRTVKHEDFRNEASEAIKLAYKLEDNIENIPSDRIVNGHIDMKNAWGGITVGWSPSQEDILADDWQTIE